MPADFIVQPCTYYFVHLSANGAPIPSTMFAKHTYKLDVSLGPCREAFLPPYQMKPTGSQKQCFNTGFRYFYLYNPQTKQVIPNSLREMTHKPEQMCIGTNQWLEYQIYTPQTPHNG